MRDRLNRLRKRWSWFDTTMAVQDRYNELEGGVVAAAVTLASFISLFPALLVGTAILGYVAAGQVDLSNQIIDKLGLAGTAAQTLREAVDASEHSRRTASIIGLAGLAWTALGVVQAIQLAVDRAWQVKGGGVVDKAKSLLWLVVIGITVIASTAATGLVVSVLPTWVPPLIILVAVATNIGMFWFTFALLGNQNVGWRPLLPGAVFAGIAM